MRRTSFAKELANRGSLSRCIIKPERFPLYRLGDRTNQLLVDF
jgi:hypothetical protein